MSPSDYFTLLEISELKVWGMPLWLSILVIVICLFISAIFSASENAFSNCNKYHFKVLAEEGKFLPKLILRLIEKFDNTLITILISNNIVQTLMSFLSAMIFYNICNYYMLGDGVEAFLSTVVMAFLIYVISDTVPKILSKEFPNKLAYILVLPVFLMYIILYPIILVFKFFLFLVHKIFRIKDENILTKEEFIDIADEAVVEEENKESNEELFEDNELKILKRAFYFDSIYVSEVLTPREKIFALDINGLTTEKLNKIILETTYSRIPIYDEDLDHIVGILVIKNYFKEYSKDKHLDIRSILTKPLFVNKDQKVDDIFKAFNKEKKHIAIVLENEKVIGMITMEDVLEELVGEINEKRVNLIKGASRK